MLEVLRAHGRITRLVGRVEASFRGPPTFYKGAGEDSLALTHT